LFVVSITYIKPLDVIDNFIKEHVEYLNTHYKLGHFQLSGRKVPRTGGIILATVESRAKLDQILSNDPFFRENLANYEVIEFVPTMSSKVLELLVDA
jgi:uncharacterized protein YciI